MKKNNTIVQFKDWQCVLEFKSYSNKRIAIQLVDAEDGSPIATATVNLPDKELKEGEVFIKDWSENEGMLRALCVAKVVEQVEWPRNTVRTGFVEAHRCKLLITP